MQPSLERGDGVHLRVSAREARIFRRLRDVFQPLHVDFERLILVGELDETSDRRKEHCRHDIESDQHGERHLAGHDLGRPDGQDSRVCPES